MCIICNVTIGDDASAIHRNVDKANRFLEAFDQSRATMQAAADAMLDVSKVCLPDDRKRYDHIHKLMVSQIREWNKLEQAREHRPPSAK